VSGAVGIPANGAEEVKAATPPGDSRTQRHARARALLADVRECELRQLGSCLGPLDVAHLDGDDANNTRGNLAKLCRSHHSLWDRRRLIAGALRQPAYFRSADGKRRYLHPGPGQLRLPLPEPEPEPGPGPEAGLERVGAHRRG
jgi:hypothetical protein